MASSVSVEPDDVVVVEAEGQLTREDYEIFVPEIERLMRQDGKLRLLFEMRDFSGWDAGAFWEDLKFDPKHHDDVDRLALVGEKKWQRWMATVCKPFTSADIRYFDENDKDAAAQWIRKHGA